jgi:hypothetical protein
LGVAGGGRGEGESGGGGLEAVAEEGGGVAVARGVDADADAGGGGRGGGVVWSHGASGKGEEGVVAARALRRGRTARKLVIRGQGLKR